MKQTKKMPKTMPKTLLLLQIESEGVEKFSALTKKGWVIIADEKSAKNLREHGMKYISIEQKVGGCGMSSLNLLGKEILAGVLASRSDKNEMSSIYNRGIKKIDMVIASIPMGGNPDVEDFNTSSHALILLSAKDPKAVTLVIDSNDYDVVIEQILKDGDTSLEMRMELASKAYSNLAYHFASLGRIINYNLKGSPKLLPE